jgi:hypothetical protein
MRGGGGGGGGGRDTTRSCTTHAPSNVAAERTNAAFRIMFMVPPIEFVPDI